jgi:hypothetical protein
LAISTGIWPDAWAMPQDAGNTISSGAAKKIRDLAVIFNADGNPRLLLMDETNTKIEVWDPRTLLAATDYSTSDALTDDLPSGGGEVWECISMCTDGTNVYGTFTDTNAAPDEHRLQAWIISSWDVKTGWPATGTALAGTGNGPLTSDCRDSKVIVADSTHLAVSCGWTSVTAAGDPAIQLFLMADGSAVRDGAGDCTLGGTYYPCEDLVSDGTNIFFVASTGAAVILCTATISDLTAGTGGAGYPLTLTGAGETFARLCMINSDTLVSIVSGSTFAAGDDVLQTHTSTDATLVKYVCGQDSQAVPVPGGETLIYSDCWSLCFDGINLWALTNSDNGAAAQLTLVKTDVGQLNTLTTRQWTDIGKPYIPGDNVGSLYNGRYLKCVFDGRDIWVILDPRNTQDYSGSIYRLPLALLRS